MARIRSIKPEFFANEQVGALAFEWRLLFIGLWLHADRAGRLLDRPVRLKAMLFPYDDLDVESGLGCLVNAGLIVRYEGDGLRLIAIPTWAKHQQPNVKEAASVLPAPDTPNDQKHGARTVPAPQEGKGREGSRKGTDHPSLRDGFERFWSEYPRKVAKDAAWKAWQAKKPDVDVAIAAVRQQRTSPQWTKDGGQFIPHARTWISQSRWNDDEFRAVAGPVAIWVCPHVDRCQNRAMCQQATFLGRPERATA